jgi:iron complex outermembrane recepter protein
MGVCVRPVLRRSCWVLLASASALLSAPAWPQAALPAEEAAEIVITGTRLPSAGIEALSPVETVDEAAFDVTGVVNIEQTLNLYPQLIPGFTNTSNNPGTGAATLDLRGLGSFRTLVLVDGRRWIANDAGSIPEVDVNTIPAALIDRVDILTGGASAVYGSDAVSGVVNIILDHDFDGLVAEAQQNISERGDAAVTSADLTFGTGFARDDGRIILSAGYLKRDALLQGERDLSRFALNEGCALAGTRTRFGLSEPAPNLAGDCSGPNEEIALLSSGSPTIPAGLISGVAFFPIDGSPALRRNMGVRFGPDGSALPFDFARDAFNFAIDNFLQVPLERRSGQALGSLSIGSTELHALAAYIRTDGDQQLASAPAMIGGPAAPARINLDNPFLPAATRALLDLNFGVDPAGARGVNGRFGPNPTVNPRYAGDADGIVVLPNLLRRRLEELGPRILLNRRDAIRGQIGARGPIAADWDFDLFASWSRARHRATSINGASASRLQQAILAVRDPATGAIRCLDPSGGCAPANIFGEGRLSPEAAAFLRADAESVTTVEEYVGEATAAGPVARLPDGEIEALAGVSARRTSYDYRPDPIQFERDFIGFTSGGPPATGAVEVKEAFVETRLPLLADRRFARELSVEAGLRFSDYADIGSVWSWKAQAGWSPLRGLRFRGGYQRAIRAPNVVELYQAERTGDVFGEQFDPCFVSAGRTADPAIAAACVRNGVPADAIATFEPGPVSAVARFGGSPDLVPEKARTLTVGVAYAGRSPLPISATLDYYDTRIERAIGIRGGGALFVTYGCILGGGDPGDPLCQAYRRDPDGLITSFDLLNDNLGAIGARGFDWRVAIDAPLDLGGATLSFSTSGTHYLDNYKLPNENFGEIECAGFFGLSCGTTLSGSVPRWKLLNQAVVDAGGLSLTLRHSYFSSTRDSRLSVNRAFGLAPVFLMATEAVRLESRHHIDLVLGVDAGETFQFRFGVNNLTDAKPAITGGAQVQANTDPSLYDVIGRRFFISVRARFSGVSR